MAEEGAKVVVADILEREGRKVEEEIRAGGGQALAVKVDVTSEEDTLNMAREAVENFGRIDVLVNNAGIVYKATYAPFTEIPLDEWDKMMAVNVKGVFLCCRAVFPQMKKQGKGKIINISSTVAFHGPVNFLHYSASKGAVVTVTRCLSKEIGQYGICVNSIAPGMVDTEASRTIMDLDKYDLSTTPLGHLGQPQDIVGAVIFFASEDSNFITGQTLVVDGGKYLH
jgi:NAD(P)-dependent dehydrogenase (short-subunit alcohol dehydrogenase family)